MPMLAGITSVLCAWVGLACAEPEPASGVGALVMAEDGSIALPSGLVVREHEIRMEPVGAPAALVGTLRLRYVASQLGDAQGFGFDRIEGDFAHLCSSFGLKMRRISAPKLEQVIISIASEPVAFGESAPEIVQYFDSFRVDSGTCIWEGL